jgi:hypothetical protein
LIKLSLSPDPFPSSIATVKAVAHGVTRAAIAVAEGGSARAGFWSGFVGSGFGSTSNNFFIGTIQTAIVGGTASILSGGKFENGARSAAFVHMFNALNRGIQKAMDRNKYPKGKQYGDGFIEVSKGALSGAISTKNVLGVARGAIESAVLNFDTVGLDIKTTVEIPVFMGEQLLDDTSEMIIDFDKEMKNEEYDFEGW